MYCKQYCKQIYIVQFIEQFIIAETIYLYCVFITEVPLYPLKKKKKKKIGYPIFVVFLYRDMVAEIIC